jgi:DNA gyrase subunit A
LFVASSKDYLLIFSNLGVVRWLKVYEIPIASKHAKGKNIVNLLSMTNNEQISSIVAVKDFSAELSVVMATAKGNVKKTKLSAFSNPRKGGIVGMTLDKDDRLIGKYEILLATKNGKSLRFAEKNIRDMGRSARGVRGIRLGDKDEVVSMLVFPTDVAKTGSTLLTVMALGYGKRSDFEEYRTQSRGGKGIINVKVTDRNGAVVGALPVQEEDEIMAITQHGMVVRCSSKDVRETGRSSQGVRLMSLKKDDRVCSVTNVVSGGNE